MTAFEKDRGSEFLLQLFPGNTHRLPIFNFRGNSPPRFIEIWRNQTREWEQFFLIRFDSLRIEERIAARCYKDRIDHQRNPWRGHLVQIQYRFRYRGNDFRGAKQTSLDRSDRKTSCEHFDLLANNFRADWLDPRNFSGNLRDDAGDGGQSIDTACRECFNVGLNAGTRAAVGTRDS